MFDKVEREKQMFYSGGSAVAIGQNAETSATLPGWTYTDPAWFERERVAIHLRTWHYAGAAQDLSEPGSYVTAQLLDQNIIVIRDGEGELRGFYNVCQHRAHELLRGRGCVRAITCPYHAWTYGTGGRFRGGRGAAQLPGFRREQFDLKPVRIETLADRFVFFNLDAGAEPLAVQAPGLAEELRAEIPQFDRLTVAEGTFTAPIRANWKATLDNYLECYHCAGAHPALGELLDLSSFRVAVHPGWMSHKADLGHPDKAAYPVSAQAGNTRARFWWLWPTTTFNVLPGSPEVSVFSFLPVAVGTTLQWGSRFGLPDPPVDAARERYRNGLLADEDIAIVESVQRGLASRGYEAGRFIVDAHGGELSEIAVHHFIK